MSWLFFILWGFLFLIPQSSLRFPFFGFELGIHTNYILVIYAAFTFPFWEGLIGCILVSALLSTLSQIPPSLMIMSNGILFIAIQTIVDRLYTEAYITKTLWVFPFSMMYQFLNALALNPGWIFWGDADSWFHIGLQGILDVLISFPMFMILDFTYEFWTRIFSSRRANLTGADMYQVKSQQRKFIS